MDEQLLPILTDADTKAAEYVAENGIPLACREGCDYCCYGCGWLRFSDLCR